MATIVQDLSYNLPAVRQAQRQLNLLGERLLVDGDLGPKTAGAIARFQLARGMSPTGRLDAVTSTLIDLATLTGSDAGTLSGRHRGEFAFGPLTPARPGFGPAQGRRGLSPAQGREDIGMDPTPAQASGRYDFVYDVPVQGPTDEGMRAASCWWAQNRTPQTPPCAPPCVDCTPPIPAWTRHNLYFGPRPSGSNFYPNTGGGPVAPSGIGGLGEAVSFGGRAVRGFGVGQSTPATVPAPVPAFDPTTIYILFQGYPGSPGSPATVPVGASMAFGLPGSSTQWQFEPKSADETVVARAYITSPQRAQANLPDTAYPFVAVGPGTTTITGTAIDGPQAGVPGVVTVTVQPAAAAAPSPIPAAQPPVPTPAAVVHKGGLSTGAMVGIGVAGAAVVGGVIYFAARGSGGGRTRRRAKRRRS